MKHPKLFFGNMVIAISMCVPLLALCRMRPARPRLLLPLPNLQPMVVLRPTNRILGAGSHSQNVPFTPLRMETGT